MSRSTKGWSAFYFKKRSFHAMLDFIWIVGYNVVKCTRIEYFSARFDTEVKMLTPSDIRILGKIFFGL